MDRIVMRVRGGEITTLYTEKINLGAFGRLHVERASNVEFDNEQGGWIVAYPNNILMLDEVFPTRQAALDAEVEYLQAQLAPWLTWEGWEEGGGGKGPEFGWFEARAQGARHHRFEAYGGNARQPRCEAQSPPARH